MTRNLIFCLVTLLLLTTSCANRGGGAESTPDLNPQTELTANMDDLLKEMEAQQGHDEELGVKTLRGKVTLDKGMQPRVNGVFIDRDYFKQDGKKWQDEVQRLKGKKVEVSGMVIRHHCGPMEQCLSQGYMDWIRKVDSFKEL